MIRDICAMSKGAVMPRSNYYIATMLAVEWISFPQYLRVVLKNTDWKDAKQ